MAERGCYNVVCCLLAPHQPGAGVVRPRECRLGNQGMNWKKHILTFVIIFLVVGMFLGPRSGCMGRRDRGTGRPPDARVVELTLEGAPDGGGHLSPYSYAVRAEVADTEAKRQQGLAGRATLEPGYGMLYVYGEPQTPEFSQATTRFPLSVAFIRGDGTIAGIRKTNANDPVAFTPEEPVKYILEVRQGWFEDRGAQVGARLGIPAGLTAAPPPDVEEPRGSTGGETPPATRLDG